MKPPTERNLDEMIVAALDESPVPKEHPAIDELLELTLDELPARRSDELHAHLEKCHICQRTVQRLLEVPEEPPRLEDEVGQEELQTAWKRLNRKIEEDAVPLPSEPPPMTWRIVPRTLYGAFAVLVLISFALGRFSVDFGRSSVKGVDGESPYGLASSHLLSERHFSRGPESAIQSADCPRQNEGFHWVLFDGTALATKGLYDLEIKRADAAPRRIYDLNAAGDGELGVFLKRQEVPNGDYVLRVFKPGGTIVQAEFQVSVQCS